MMVRGTSARGTDGSDDNLSDDTTRRCSSAFHAPAFVEHQSNLSRLVVDHSLLEGDEGTLDLRQSSSSNDNNLSPLPRPKV